ncbi:hypothetical protein ABFG93_08245 [Pseudalkalibacillus hwajinpoensis]|uniref:hypothetical protein n=1 Tax=Guptibacillus hwajinpoensis TaxID=208199 RepID=UPI00325B443F
MKLFLQEEKYAGVKLLDGSPYYLTLENIEKLNTERVINLLNRMEEHGQDRIQYINVVMDATFLEGADILEHMGYQLKSRFSEFERDLLTGSLNSNDASNMTYYSAKELGEKLFLNMWESCMKGSLKMLPLCTR